MFYRHLYKNNKLKEKETLSLPKGYFRVVILFTILLVYINVFIVGSDEKFKQVSILLGVIVGFYFALKLKKNE